MLDVNSDANEILDAILKDKTADEQVKILRVLYSDAVGHGWVDDDLRNNILKHACSDYDIEYDAGVDEEEEDDDDDLEKEFEDVVGR